MLTQTKISNGRQKILCLAFITLFSALGTPILAANPSAKAALAVTPGKLVEIELLLPDRFMLQIAGLVLGEHLNELEEDVVLINATGNLGKTEPQRSIVYKGITLDYKNGVVYIVDTSKNAVLGPFFSGIATNFHDVVLTPDQNTVILSSFYDNKIFFADISNIENPIVSGFLDFSSIPSPNNPFNPEDLAITVDGQYIVVSDGATDDCGYVVNSGVASIQVGNRTPIQYLTLESPKQAQSIAIDKFGNVFVGDWCNKKLYVLKLNNNGTLTDTGMEIDLPFKPLNSCVSPDSSRLLVVGSNGVRVYQIIGQGSITQIRESLALGKIQSMAFSLDEERIFLGDVSTSLDRIIVANINDLSVITTVNLLSDLTGGFYGVDVMSIVPDGQKLYMGNMSKHGLTTNKLMVLNLSDYSLSSLDLADTSVATATTFRGVYRIDLYLPMLMKSGP